MNQNNIDTNKISENDLKLLSLNATRKLLGISHESTKKLTEDGIIESVKINGRIRIPYYKLRKFIENTNSSFNSKNSKKNVFQEDENEIQTIIENLKKGI